MAMGISTSWFGCAVGSGACFAVIGIVNRIGKSHGIVPARIVFYLSLFAAAACVVRAGDGILAPVPGWVLALAVVTALLQYATAKMMSPAMRFGPMSPIWCAISLGFVPVILYSALWLGERITVPHGVSVGAAIGCVVAGTAGVNGTGGRIRGPLDRTLVYGVLLLGMLLANGFSSIAFKVLQRPDATGVPVWKSCAEGYLLVMYVTLALTAAPAEWRRVHQDGKMLQVAGLGLLAAAGSLGGSLLIAAAAATGSAAQAFTVGGIAQILIVATAMVLFFRERVTARWLLALALGSLSVAMGVINE